MKTCSRCGEKKTEQDFYSRANGRLTSWCRPCHIKATAEYRARDPERWKKYQKEYRSKQPRERLVGYSLAYKRRYPERVRDQWYRAEYGIGLAEYEALFSAQLGLCAACQEPPPTTGTATQRKLNVDHNHKTGEIRGLLCSHCNRILGFADDEASVLLALVAYLDRRRAWTEIRIEVS
jgi:hypothetical protein